MPEVTSLQQAMLIAQSEWSLDQLQLAQLSGLLAELFDQPAEKAKPEVSKNFLVTDEEAEEARTFLRKKLSQLNSGLDP